MEIVQADQGNESIVLELLDQFRTYCIMIASLESPVVSYTARETGSKLFTQVVSSSSSVIYLAKQDNDYIGIITIHLIPQIRKGSVVAEIEDIFVLPEHHGKGVAGRLMNVAMQRAKKKGASALRLESSNELSRAHAFYIKYGFSEYGKAFKLAID